MNIMKIIAVTTCLLVGGFVSADKAVAASSEWMDAYEAKRFISKVLRRKKNVPTSKKCRNNPKFVGLNGKNMMVKIGYRPNPKGQGWGVALGAGHVGSFERKYPKRNYVRVSSGGYRRKSGLLIPCVVWHQNGKK